MLGDECVVPSKLFRGEDLTPASTRPAVEERRFATFERALEQGAGSVLVTHRLEPAAVNGTRPPVARYIDSQKPGDPAHLAVEVGEQIRVVHEQHERLVAEGPPRCEMLHRSPPVDPLVEEYV